MNAIHILRPGSFTGTNGQTVTFSAADIAAIAQGYDVALHEAPIVAGHPRTDTPAYGWVASLSARSDGLHATAHQLDAQFTELVRTHRFKKVSGAFYGPAHPNNPTPGQWYLRHVGFLGAQPPAVKGLKEAQLADDPDATVIEWALAEPTPTLKAPRLSDPSSKQGNTMPENTDELAEREAALATREATLREREQTATANEAVLAEREATQRRESVEALIEAQITAGRVLPVDRQGLIALGEALFAEPVTIELAEGTGKNAQVIKTDTARWFSDWLGRLPQQVNYTEATPNTGAGINDARTAGFGVPQGYTVDSEAQALHQQALALAEKNEIDYDQALLKLTQSQPGGAS